VIKTLPTPQDHLKERREVATRWGGDPVITSNGFLPVATSFLWYAAHLEPGGLNPAQMLFVLHLMSHKWSEKKPYPSYERVAGRMGVSVAYCRKIARDLEKRGFLKRTQRQGESNLYDLSPLFAKLAVYVQNRRREKTNLHPTHSQVEVRKG